MLFHQLEAVTARYTGKDPVTGRLPADRRQRRRTPVRWPVTIWKEDGSLAVESVTDNLSSSGFYCLSPIPLTPGEPVRCAVRIPAYNPDEHNQSIDLDCAAVVVRAAAVAGGSFGIACRIDEYHLAGDRQNHK